MNALRGFLADNFTWMIASLILAFGLWIIAVLQTDPVEERDFPRRQRIDVLVDDNMLYTFESPEETVLAKVRAPRSVWDSLRDDDIDVIADLRGEPPGTHTVELKARLAGELHGEVVETTPARVEITLEEIALQRLPIRVTVSQDPPSGYAAAAPECTLTEVTAEGAAGKLEGAMALARLDLSQERNPVTLTTTLVAVDARGRTLTDIDLEPDALECTVQIAQREGVSELSVVPTIRGFPASGYIYEGYDFEPKTVVITGQPSAIREMNGIVNTEPIDLTDATGNFERAVGVILPQGVRLLPATQLINVSIKIGTVPSSRQYENISVQVEGLGSGLDAELLPGQVTVFTLGPQPTLESLPPETLRVMVNLEGLAAGTYQIPTFILMDNLPQDISITLEPAEISVTIIEIDELAPR